MVKAFRPPQRPRKQNHHVKLETIELCVDALDHEGVGVAKTHSPIAFVSGGLPQENCLVEVTEKKKNFIKAKVKKVLTTSPERQEPMCQYFHSCGGCQTQYIAQDAMLKHKQVAITQLLDKLTRGAALTLEGQLPWHDAIADEATGYRRKARIAVDFRKENAPKIGFRGKGSNQIVDIDACPVLMPKLQALMVPLRALCLQLSNTRAIGHIELLLGDEKNEEVYTDGRPLVVFRVTKSLSQQDRATLTDFAETHQCDLALELKNGGFEVLHGQSANIEYALPRNVKLQAQASDFIQVNPAVNRQMVNTALAWLDVNEDDRVLDLYCGLGNFSLPIASIAEKVIGVEGVPEMVQRASENAHKNGITRSAFYCQNLDEADALQKWQSEAINKVLLDPSRVGAKHVIPQITELKPEKILYVSCNPATFGRDIASLIQDGDSKKQKAPYKLSKIAILDMFPYTAHTEIMALFERR